MEKQKFFEVNFRGYVRGEDSLNLADDLSEDIDFVVNSFRDKALTTNSSLEISKGIGYYLGTCEALENLANTYSKMGDIDKSHDLIEKSLKIRYEIGCENGIEKTRNKMDLIKSGNREINIELKSSPVHNNLFPSKGIKISKPRESGKINFSLVNNIIDDINKFVKNYND